MTKLEQLDNALIAPADYQAPTGQQEITRFVITRTHWLLAAMAVLCLLFIAFITLARSVQVIAITPLLDTPEEFVTQTADVEISGYLKLPIGNRVLILPGEQTVSVKAEGFASIEQTLSIGSERHQQFEIILTRLPGNLQISLQDGLLTPAQVLIDGEPFATLPGLVENVPAGKHKITVDAPLYRPLSKNLVVEGKAKTQSLAFELQPAWAEYTLSSTPEAADIIVDDQLIAKTPATIKLEEGLRRLVIKAAGFKPFTQEVGVVAQQDLTIAPIDLVPADGVLSLRSKPDKAAVILNGEFRGTTPLKLNVEPNQSQRLQVYKAGYQLLEQDVSLVPAQESEKDLQLRQDLVSVRVSVSPSDAQVYVDGALRGSGSQTLSLNTLPHSISVRKKGYVTQNNDIIPTKGNKQIISVALLTQEQHYWAQLPSAYTNRQDHSMKLFKAPGKVMMGSSRREAGRRANEVQFTAELDKAFYVSLHETSNSQFRAFKPTHSSGNYKKKSLDANKAPAVNISWQEAALYCNWLSKQEKLDPFYQTKSGYVSGYNRDANGYRLLTEAEWAWLARNKDDGVLLYPWGNNSNIASGVKVGNFADQKAAELIAFTLRDYNDGYRGPSPVGRFPANHRGLFDVGGNASEWVNDWYSAKGSTELKGSGTLKNPLGPDIGEFHVVRGGSWAKGHLPQLRLAYRDYGAKGKHDVGFRVARYAGLTKGKK